jgi:hypothetical protein
MMPEFNAAAVVEINAKLTIQMEMVSDHNRSKESRIESLADVFRLCLTDSGKLLIYNSPRFRESAIKKMDEFWDDQDVQQNQLVMDLIIEVYEVVDAVERGEEIQF